MEDASNQGRMIDDLDKDDALALMDDKEEDKKEEEAKVVEDDQVKGRDPEAESTTSSIIPVDTKSKDKGKGIMLNKYIDWGTAIDHVKQKAKEDPPMQRYQVMKKKPQTEAQARKNMIMYLKNTKEQMEEEENRAIQSINETPAEKAAKKRKLNEEVEDLKSHLEILPDEDDELILRPLHLQERSLLWIMRSYI
nr:hypothetical protein [Tanacetum cinerariifolium]